MKNRLRNICLLISVCFWIGSVTIVSSNEQMVVSKEQEETLFTGTPEEIYQKICSSEHVSIVTAYESFQEVSMEGEEDQQLQEYVEFVEDLMKCRGVYIQEKDPEKSTGKTYTATVDYFIQNGVMKCEVEYTNYGGELESAEVVRIEKEGYVAKTEPKGEYYGKEHQFCVEIGAEQLHIQWADSCDYMLYKSDGSMDSMENTVTPFEEKEIYATLTVKLDELFKDQNLAYHMQYKEEEHTLYLYIEAFPGIREGLQENSSLKESWVDYLESLKTLANAIGTAVSLSEREGSHDFTDYYCEILIVDSLNDSDEYDSSEILAKVTADEIKENLDTSFNSEHSNEGKQSGGSFVTEQASATMGERNALQRAKDYLEYSAFSYTGLIEQLEYEGYSYSEAQYGADHCGADWYEQAKYKARDYLEYSAFSKDGLIDQLEYEGFTYEQALYGVQENGY